MGMNMKTRRLTLLTALAGGIAFGCTPDAPDDTVPTITIESPTAGQLFGLGDTVTVSGTVADAGGNLDKVQVRANSSVVDATVTGGTFTIDLSTVADGTTLISAVATDSAGFQAQTDPVEIQIQLHEQRADTIAYLEPHVAFFTFGENYGRPGCWLPVSEQFQFRPTRQPIVLDFWKNQMPAGGAFTTIGNWMQKGRDLRFGGDIYRWSKHHEFLKVLDLPARSAAAFELALSGNSIANEFESFVMVLRKTFVCKRPLYELFVCKSITQSTFEPGQWYWASDIRTAL